MTTVCDSSVDKSVYATIYTLINSGALNYYDTFTLGKLPTNLISNTTYSFYDIGQDLVQVLNDPNVISAIKNLINQESSSTNLIGYCGAVDKVSIAVTKVLTNIHGSSGVNASNRNRIQISASDGVLLYDSRFGPNGGSTGISNVYLTEGGNGSALTQVKLKNSPDNSTTTNLFGISSRGSYLGYIDSASNPGNNSASFFNSNFTFNSNTRSENIDAINHAVGYNSRISGTTNQLGSYVTIKVPFKGTFVGENSCYNSKSAYPYTGDFIILKHNYFA